MKNKFFCVLIFSIILVFGALGANFVNVSYAENALSYTEFSSQLMEMVSTYDNSGGLLLTSCPESTTETSKEESNFELKRLIVYSSQNVDSKGAVQKIEGYKNYHIFQYATEEQTEIAYNYYSSLSSIKWVSPDFVVTAEEIDAGTQGINDSFSYTTWGADCMGIEAYSNYLLSTYGSEANLPEVVVAVLDTGLDLNHTWFTNRIADGGKSFVSDENYVQDGHSHGTHVAGTIVDLTLSNVKILPLKVLGANGQGTMSGIMDAVEYVIQLKTTGVGGIQYDNLVMNLSLGGTSAVNSPTWIQGVPYFENAFSNGILSAVAAGNEADNACNHYPANAGDSVLTVASVTSEACGKSSSYFSNYGTLVDVCAPGESIASACLNSTNGTCTKSGTSMASPHVAGAIALLLSDGNKHYTSQNLKDIICSHATDLGEDGKDEVYGYGIVNLQYAYADEINEVTFSQTNTQISNAFNLTLSSTTQNAEIYYTLDGSTPSLTNGTQYSSPITINQSQYIKAIAYTKNGGTVTGISVVKSQLYEFTSSCSENDFVVSGNTLTKYTGSSSVVVVPSTIGGVTITTIGDGSSVAFPQYVTSVTLSNSVTTINCYAFLNCRNLKTITANGVTELKGYAFYGCESLTEINDSNFASLQKIYSYAFHHSGITNVSLSNLNTVYACAFYICHSLTTVKITSLTTVNGYSFDACHNLEKIYLINAEILEQYAVLYCVNARVYLPNVLTLNQKSVYEAKSVVIGTSLTTYYSNSCTSGVIVYGYANSTAQTFANANSLSFVAINAFSLSTDVASSIIASVDEEKQISVTVSGFDVTYQWFSSSTNSYNGTKISQATSSSLTLDTSTEGTKYYYVKITNWDQTSTTSSICTVTVEDYIITASSSAGGSISPSGAVAVEKNANQTFTFSANTDYYAEFIEVDGTKLSSEELTNAIQNGYTFQNVTASHTIYVQYKITQYTITSSSSTGGSISPLGETEVDKYANQTFTFTANNGYEIDYIQIDGTNLNADDLMDAKQNGYTFENITASHTIFVQYKEIQYTITFNLDGGAFEGAIENPMHYTITSEQFTLPTPSKADYTFLGWTSDDISSLQTNVIISTGSTGNKTFTANWQLEDYTITSSSSANGTISPLGETEVDKYTSQTFTFTANNGYEIDYIQIDGTNLNADDLMDAKQNGYTFENITASHTIFVQYKEIQYTITFNLDGGTFEGTIENPMHYTITSEQFTLPVATKEGHDFLGWTGSNGDTATIEVIIPFGTTGNKTYTANWQIKSYTLTYNATENAGTTTATTQIIEYNQSIDLTKTAISNQQSWQFVGWTDEQNGTQAKTEILMPAHDLTIYAIFKKEFEVVFYSGINKATTQNVLDVVIFNKQTSCQVQASAISAIQGWQAVGYVKGTQAQVSNLEISAENIGTTQLIITKDTFFYAVYKREVTIKYYSGTEGNFEQKTKIQYYNSGDEISNVTSDYVSPSTIQNWSALGYREDNVASVAKITQSQTLTPKVLASASYAYYAVYSQVLTVSFDGNEGTGSVDDKTLPVYLNVNGMVLSEQAIVMPSNNFEKIGYTFTSWKIANSNKEYLPSNIFEANLCYDDSFHITFFAQWTKTKFYVSQSGYINVLRNEKMIYPKTPVYYGEELKFVFSEEINNTIYHYFVEGQELVSGQNYTVQNKDIIITYSESYRVTISVVNLYTQNRVEEVGGSVSFVGYPDVKEKVFNQEDNATFKVELCLENGYELFKWVVNGEYADNQNLTIQGSADKPYTIKAVIKGKNVAVALNCENLEAEGISGGNYDSATKTYHVGDIITLSAQAKTGYEILTKWYHSNIGAIDGGSYTITTSDIGGIVFSLKATEKNVTFTITNTGDCGSVENKNLLIENQVENNNKIQTFSQKYSQSLLLTIVPNQKYVFDGGTIKIGNQTQDIKNYISNDVVIAVPVSDYSNQNQIKITLNYNALYWEDEAKNRVETINSKIVVKEDFSGEGTKDNPYILKTPSDLALLSYVVNNNIEDYNTQNCYYILKNDIDLQEKYWTPIGAKKQNESNQTTFYANISFANCKITNASIDLSVIDASSLNVSAVGKSGCQNVFASISEDATLTNKTFDEDNNTLTVIIIVLCVIGVGLLTTIIVLSIKKIKSKKKHLNESIKNKQMEDNKKSFNQPRPAGSNFATTNNALKHPMPTHPPLPKALNTQKPISKPKLPPPPPPKR